MTAWVTHYLNACISTWVRLTPDTLNSTACHHNSLTCDFSCLLLIKPSCCRPSASPVCAMLGVEGGQGVCPSPLSCSLGRSVCKMSVSSRDTASVGTPLGGKDPLCRGEEWKSGDINSVSASEKGNKKQRPVLPTISPACGSCKFE